METSNSEATSSPIPGQLKGIGLRLDPAGILIAPSETNGLIWGYTIIDKTQIPTMFMNDEWSEVVPKGVWLQMLENWEALKGIDQSVFERNPVYKQYPELMELFA
jgi:hypothetical protein